MDIEDAAVAGKTVLHKAGKSQKGFSGGYKVLVGLVLSE